MKKLFLLFLLLCNQLQAINIKLLKGTHAIASPDYSPVMGISFLEWDMAEKWYRLSPKHQAKEIQSVADKDPKNAELQKFAQSMAKQENNATQNLVMSMYHIVRNSFITTHAVDNPVRQLKSRHIGQIMRIIQEKMDELKHIGSTPQKQQEEKEQIKNKLAVLTKENNDLSGKIQKINAALKKEKNEENEKLKKGYDERILEIKKEKKSLEDLQKITELKDPQEYIYAKLRSELMDTLNSLGFTSVHAESNQDSKNVIPGTLESEESNEASLQEVVAPTAASGTPNKQNKVITKASENKKPKEKILKWNRFVDALIGSLKECTGDNPVYPENTTQGLLLSYLLAKSDTKQDLEEYFKALLGKKNLVLPSEEYSSQDIEQILEKQTDLKDFDQFAEFVSAYTYKTKYDALLPKIVNAVETEYKGIHFADCMDTTIRMLANIVTYQQGHGKVGVVPEGIKLNPAIQKFYNDPLCQKSEEVGNSNVHKKWANAIENVPHCIYAKIGTGPDDVIDVAVIKTGNIAGVIPVDHELVAVSPEKVTIDGKEYEPYILSIGNKTYQVAQKKIGNETYLLIPKKSNLMCLEAMPNYLNLVTNLNYIFDLHLYTNFHEIFEPEFISKKFKIICEKLGWQADIDFKDLDKTEAMNIPIENDKGKFSININYNGHGEINVVSDEKIKTNITEEDFAQPSISAAMLGTGSIGYSKLKSFHFQSFHKLLDDPNKISFIFNMLSYMDETEKIYVKNDIINFVLADDVVSLNRAILFLKNIITSYNYQLSQLGIDAEFIKQLLTIFKIKAYPDIYTDAAEFLLEYKVLTASEFIECVKKRINDLIGLPGYENYVGWYIKDLQKIFDKDLVTKNEVPSLLALVKQIMVNANSSSFQAVEELISSLINKKLLTQNDIAELLVIIKQGITDSNDKFFNNALNSIILLAKEKLLTQNDIVDLLVIIKEKINDSNENVRIHSIKAIANLINYYLLSESEIPDALAIIKQTINDSNKEVRTESISTIKSLIYNKLLPESEIPDLIVIIKEKVDDQNIKNIYEGLNLMSTLVEYRLIANNQYYDLLADKKQEIINPNEKVSYERLLLIISLNSEKLLLKEDMSDVLSIIKKGINDFEVPGWVVKILIGSLAEKKLLTQNDIAEIEKIANNSDMQEFLRKKMFEIKANSISEKKGENTYEDEHEPEYESEARSEKLRLMNQENQKEKELNLEKEKNVVQENRFHYEHETIKK